MGSKVIIIVGIFATILLLVSSDSTRKSTTIDPSTEAKGINKVANDSKCNDEGKNHDDEEGGGGGGGGYESGYGGGGGGGGNEEGGGGYGGGGGEGGGRYGRKVGSNTVDPSKAVKETTVGSPTDKRQAVANAAHMLVRRQMRNLKQST